MRFRERSLLSPMLSEKVMMESGPRSGVFSDQVKKSHYANVLKAQTK